MTPTALTAAALRSALRPVPEWLKRVGEAALCAAASGLATWAVEDAKAAVRARAEQRREAARAKKEEEEGPADADTETDAAEG